VGISILTPSTITAVPLAQEIKKELPSILVGCGGTHICVDTTFIERYPYFDFGVKGEGELIMEEILNKYKSGKKISGMYNGGYIKNIEDLPFPDYTLIDFENYGYPLDKAGKRKSSSITMISSRGCPFNCTFCTKTESRRHVRYRSAKNIVDEIETNYHFAPGSPGVYNFVDDTMTLNRENATEVCREIIRRKLKISWLAMTRADCLGLNLVKLMGKSGCRELFIGVESGDPRVRNQVIKKRVKDRDIKKAINVCRKFGIRTSIFLMLGFPTEGKKEIERTVDYPFNSGADMMGIHLTCPLPGSELYYQAIKEKIIPEDVVDRFIRGEYGEEYSFWPKYVPQGLTLGYLEKARSRAIRKFYLSPKFVWRLLNYYRRSPSKIKYDQHLYRGAISILLAGRSKIQFS